MNTILAITYSFFLSYMPMHDIGFNIEKSERFRNSTHVEFMIGADIFDMVHIYGGEETYQQPHNNFFNWQPYRQSYIIGAEWHKEFEDTLKIKSGVRHKCTHPINCWNKQLSKSNESFTEIYIDVSGKLNIF